MSELRTTWTPQQVQERTGEANESLPEARTTDRYPAQGRSSGVDVLAGEDLAGPAAAQATASGTGLQVPPDPPQHLNDQGGQ
ncbi:MAG: hypothetical protein WBX27_20455 [Specibacter sp.]